MQKTLPVLAYTPHFWHEKLCFFFSLVKSYYLYLHVFIVYLILPVTDSQTDGHSEFLEKTCSSIGLFICRFWLSLGKY